MSAVTNLFYARQLDLLDVEKLPPVAIIGYGGVGSSIALYLAKMGVREWHIWDPDTVADHNISNQMFPRSSVGRLKVDVAEEMIRGMSPMPSRLKISTHAEAFTSSTPVPKGCIVISGLDSIAARRDVWSSVSDSGTNLYIDARMGGEVAKVYSLNPFDGERRSKYKASLEQAEYNIPCTARAIAYNVALIASVVCRCVAISTAGVYPPFLIVGDSHNFSLIRIGDNYG